MGDDDGNALQGVPEWFKSTMSRDITPVRVTVGTRLELDRLASFHGAPPAPSCTPNPSSRPSAGAGPSQAAQPPASYDQVNDTNGVSPAPAGMHELRECLRAWQDELEKQFQNQRFYIEDIVATHMKAPVERARTEIQGVKTSIDDLGGMLQQQRLAGAAGISSVDVSQLQTMLTSQLQVFEEKQLLALHEWLGERLAPAFKAQQQEIVQAMSRQRVANLDSIRSNLERKRSKDSAASQDHRRFASASEDVGASLSGSVFVGQWVDHAGRFFHGAILDITSSNWRLGHTAQGEFQNAQYTRTVLSDTHWQLHMVTASGALHHFDLTAIEQDDTLMVQSADSRHVLHRINPMSIRRHIRHRADHGLGGEQSSPSEDWMSSKFFVEVTPFMTYLYSWVSPLTNTKRPHLTEFSAATKAVDKLLWLAHTKQYEILLVVSIFLDAIVLVWGTQRASKLAMSQPAESMDGGIEDSIILIALSDFFCFLFTLDVALRMTAEGKSFWRRNAGYFFDIFVVLTYIMEAITNHIFLHERSYSGFRTIISQLSMLRVLRLLEIGKKSKVVRHHSAFRELRCMLYALHGIFKSLLWSFFLLLMIILIFGVMITEGTLAYCVSSRALLAEDTLLVRKYFGTLSDSVLTLAMCMSSGIDWGQVYESLAPLEMQYRMLFLFYQAFTFIALLNVVNAVFVGSTMHQSQNDRESLVADEICNRKKFLKSVHQLFMEFDSDDNGEVSFEELVEYVKQPHVAAYFATFGVDANEIGRLFDLLDKDRSGTIDCKEFMFGCLHLKGEAKSLDIAILQYDVELMMQGMADLGDNLGACLLKMNRFTPFQASPPQLDDGTSSVCESPVSTSGHAL